MLCPNCKRGVISYYRYCPWCGTNVTAYAEDVEIWRDDETVGYRMVGKCPQCGKALSSEDIRVERWYTDEGAILNSEASVFRRYVLVCKECETIIGFSS